MRTLFTVLALGICAVTSAQVETSSQLPVLEPKVFSGKVVRIRDGNSITVLVAREQVDVRLHGIDAAEYKQPFGNKARKELGKLVRGKRVRLEKIDTDRYGRSVFRVYSDELDINAEMVSAASLGTSDDIATIRSWLRRSRKLDRQSVDSGLMLRRWRRGTGARHCDSWTANTAAVDREFP